MSSRKIRWFLQHSAAIVCIGLLLPAACSWPESWIGRDADNPAPLATDANKALDEFDNRHAATTGSSAATATTSTTIRTDTSSPNSSPRPPIDYRKSGSGRFLNSNRVRAETRRLPDGNLVLNFANADLRDVVQTILGDTLGVAYIIDANVSGLVDLESLTPLSAEAALSVLETVLQMNGAALIVENDLYRVVPIANVPRAARPVIGTQTKPLLAGYGMRVVPLKFIGADAMAALLLQITTQSAGVISDPARNLIMLTGTSKELANLIELVALFDADWLSGMSTALVALEEADAATVATEIEALFRTKTNGPLSGIIQIIVIERLNALLIATPRVQYLDEARGWIERLDRGVAAGRNLYVIELENAQAKNLAELLNDVFTDQDDTITNTLILPSASPARFSRRGTDSDNGTATPNRPADAPKPADRRSPTVTLKADDTRSGNLTGDVKIIADEQKNALVVLALPQDYRMIAAAVRQLDTAPPQVLIEATIAEVTLRDELRYGVQWFFKSGGLGIAESSTGVLSLGTTQALTPTFPGFSLIVNGADGVRAILDALDTVTTLNVISSPHLIVRDNGTAELKVGDEVPVATQQRQSTDDPNAPLVSTINFRDTGVILKVTPRVNANGQINLQISQEVSSVSESVDSGLLTPTISQRQIKSNINVQSGESIVLGGLISESKSNTSQGLPFLARLPVVGALFGQKNDLTNRTELLVLISPRVIRDSAEARHVTEEIRSKLKRLKDLSDYSVRPAQKPIRKLD